MSGRTEVMSGAGCPPHDSELVLFEQGLILRVDARHLPREATGQHAVIEATSLSIRGNEIEMA